MTRVSDESKLKKFISSRLSPTTSFVIPEIKPQQVSDIFSKISVNKATGHDGLSAKILQIYPLTCRFARSYKTFVCGKKLLKSQG